MKSKSLAAKASILIIGICLALSLSGIASAGCTTGNYWVHSNFEGYLYKVRYAGVTYDAVLMGNWLQLKHPVTGDVSELRVASYGGSTMECTNDVVIYRRTIELNLGDHLTGYTVILHEWNFIEGNPAYEDRRCSATMTPGGTYYECYDIDI